MNFLKRLILFFVGGFIYIIIETLWRGQTHPSMFIVGGICFLLSGQINEFFSWQMPLIKQGIIAAILITSVEFFSGCILNIFLKLNVWDYSNLPFNILGQICPQFSFVWFLLGIVAIILDDYLRYYFFQEQKPHYVI